MTKTGKLIGHHKKSPFYIRKIGKLYNYKLNIDININNYYYRNNKVYTAEKKMHHRMYNDFYSGADK